MARFLVNVDDHEVVAYAPRGHDFYRASDDVLWAHESEGRLLAARSGTMLARKSGRVYYDADNDAPLYYQSG
jgi:hypothetical protein